MRWRTLAEERGTVLLLVLVAMQLLLVMSSSLFSIAMVERQISHYQGQDICLHYLAEAGLELGVASLKEDFHRAHPLEGEMAGGFYRVTFETVDPETRRVISTARLEGHELLLAVLVEANPLYRKAVVSGPFLQLEEVRIYGDLHASGEVLLGGANIIAGGRFSYSGPPPQFKPGSYLKVEGNTYINSLQIQRALLNDRSIPLAAPDFEKYAAMASCTLPGPLTLAQPPSFPEARESFLVNGDLVIAPDPAGAFDFSGLLAVRGDLTVYAREGEVKLEGFLAVEGDVLIIGDLNRSRSDALLAIVAGENIFVEEIERPLLGGGELLLFAGEALVLDWRGTEPLELRGAVIGRQLLLSNCRIAFSSAPARRFEGLLPGAGAVITHWYQQYER